MCNFIPNLQIITLCISILSYVSRAQAEGISCFKCLTSLTKPEDTDLLCSHFDGSAKFQTFCPTSTLCMKRTIQYKSKTSVVTTVQRDCAPQKYTSHNYNENDKQWYKTEEVIETAYKEGCFIGEHRGAPTSPPEYCFCGYHLCNLSSPQIGMFSKVYGPITALLIMRML
ncbi:uncharacterized protein [Linepithema humile]|uniref:uncharacterized protein n=1 Tax=Linepithema humile TaxID=83485 RepID=UPI00062323DC|nr:PREDICTED: uncharacterized protein LOC105672213 [Linepithema humile]